ncbi:MAG: hypothetical protein Q7K03_11175 [Dehalococcoidia bacterium]|nr:hypothetical protein [Dehalococcoidia bacterium]
MELSLGGAGTLGGFCTGHPTTAIVRDMGKNLLFYTVASTVIALVAQVLGASMGVVLMASLLGPPVILLALAIVRYNR